MKKVKTLLTLGAACLLLVGCGETKSNSDAPESKQTPKSSEVNQSKDAPVSKGQSSATPATSATPSSMSVPTTQGVIKKDKPYKIFNTVPEIKFVTNAGADMQWATTPGKDSTKPEVPGWITTSGIDGAAGLENEPAGMKVRGNYTSNYQKKPFRIKFDTKRNILGLNGNKKYKKWVLLADVKDTAMLRNAATFYLAKHLMPSTVFVPDYTPVHLYLNDTYWGMYTLTEQKEVGEGRVDIAKVPSGSDRTDVGYFFELDNYYSEEAAKGEDGDPTFTVTYKPAPINWHHNFENFTRIQQGYTVSSDITNRNIQLPYLQKRVEMAYQVIYDAVMNNKFQRIENEQLVADNSSTLEECLAKTIDIDSFVGMYLLHDIVVDPDIGYSSFYLSLDMSETGNHLLTLNNPWDFDSALGTRKGGDEMGGRASTETTNIKKGEGEYASKSSNMWFSIISKAPFFQEKIKAKYKELYDNNVFQAVTDMIDDYAATYSAGYTKNFQKWPRTMGNNPETNFEVVDEIKRFSTHSQCVNYLKTWFNNRVTWLNGFYIDGQGGGGGGEVPPVTPDIDTFKANATPFRLEAEDSEIADGNPTGESVSKKERANEGISGNKYVGGLDGNNGATMTWTFNRTAKSDQVFIVAGLSARTGGARTFDQMFTITVNDEVLTTEDVTIPAGTGNDYHCWTTVDVAWSKLKQGSNTIVVTSTGSATNFDYLDVYVPNA